jgi:nucleotide-binding universal stress UspA family protein
LMPELPIAKILLPVDFSAKAEEAAQYAAQLSKHFHSEVVLLHVLEPLHLDFAMAELPASMEKLSELQCERAQQRLDHFAVSDFQGARVIRRIVRGQPAEEILAAAENVDLVVMPTQGHGRLREFLIGSVTAKVLHDCTRPVLTGVHLAGNPRQEWQVRHVLCAIDFGSESALVLKWGAQLAAEFGSQVSIIHAGVGGGEEFDAAQKIEVFARAAGLNATPIIAPGEPHAEVTAAAQRIGADLVLIGRGSTPGFTGRLRAQAYAIVRKSPCPVLSV